MSRRVSGGFVVSFLRQPEDKAQRRHSQGGPLKKIWITSATILWMSLLLCFGQAQRFHFILLTDTQFGMYADDKGFAHETANFEFAVAAVNRWKPGFVVVLGDLVNRAADPAQVSEYKRIAGKIDPSIPVYQVAGNHDIGNEPTPESIDAYRKNFGKDYYGFQAGPIYGIVLNSTLIHKPDRALPQYREQEAWFLAELERAKASGAQQIVLFLHHPPFLASAQEPDQYENLPLHRRLPLLELLHKYGIRNVFAGHTHKNVVAQDGTLRIVATGPVGKPLGPDGSGMRVASVGRAGLDHQYFDFGRLPESLELAVK
jgi:3',5'-cyclic AMP phosphodiesterase CpdA